MEPLSKVIISDNAVDDGQRLPTSRHPILSYKVPQVIGTRKTESDRKSQSIAAKTHDKSTSQRLGIIIERVLIQRTDSWEARNPINAANNLWDDDVTLVG